MLASLLPGVRELRAPFVAGALLLATAYLIGYEALRAVIDEERLDPALQSLLDRLGSTGSLAVLCCVAYLLGTIVVLVLELVVTAVNRQMLHRIVEPAYLFPEGRPPSHLLAPFTRPSLRRLQWLCNGDQRMFYNICLDVLTGGGKRLLVTNKDLYVEYDRLRAEAEFRDAVAIPAVALAVAVVSRSDWDWWVDVVTVVVGLLGAITLVLQARLIARGAYSMYGHAVVDGFVSTPTLDAHPSSTSEVARRPDRSDLIARDRPSVPGEASVER